MNALVEIRGLGERKYEMGGGELGGRSNVMGVKGGSCRIFEKRARREIG